MTTPGKCGGTNKEHLFCSTKETSLSQSINNIYSNAYKTHTYSLQLGQMQNDNCEKGVEIWNVEKATNNPFLLNGCDFGLEKK